MATKSPFHGKRRLTAAQRDEVVRRYGAGESSPHLGAEYGCSGTNICSLVRRRGLPRRTNREAHTKYHCNHFFFDGIETELQAYWLGFFLADGHVPRKRNEISLTLAAVDRQHVVNFGQALGSQHPIKTFKTKGFRGLSEGIASRISIRSPELSAALRRISLDAVVMGADYTVPGPLRRHFWRGQVDGNGHVGRWQCLKKPNYYRWRIQLSAFEHYCAGLLDFVQTQVATKATVRPHKSIHCVEFFGRSLPIAVADHLYSDCTIALQRKRSVAMAMIADAPNIRHRRVRQIPQAASA